MKKNLLSATIQKSENASVFEAGTGVRSGKLRGISGERLAEILLEVEQKITAGLSKHAEKILVETLENHSHTPENEAELKRLLSYSLETLGKYKEALAVIEPYHDEEILNKLEISTQIKVSTRLAISYNNLSDSPKAVTLLKETLQKAQDHNLTKLFGHIYSALARAYRKLNELPISRDRAEKALDYFREQGDWYGMAESYEAIAVTHHQEGHSEKALEFFELGIKIIGERAAPFLLGRIYSNMSGAYWFLRRAQDGIACLEKSIKFFDQTEHKLNSVIAYNNLGINLMLLGEWARAEKIIIRALEIARGANHAHVSGILDSLGELKLLRGELDEAQELLEEGVEVAENLHHKYYAIQAMRNLARCSLAQGKFDKAIEKAKKTIEICQQIGEKQIANMAALVLAESFLKKGEVRECKNQLEAIEATDPSSDFFVLGNIQRIRGLIALEKKDEEIALHHFSRSLTIFETAEDLYQTAYAHYLMGQILAESQSGRALKHLKAAIDVFRKLGVDHLLKLTEEILETLKNTETPAKSSGSVSSQLLMLRLAEANASRELLFRELVSILQQESRARRIIIAEFNDQKRFYPFITHGFIPSESVELVAKFYEAQTKNEVENFAKTKNLNITQLRAPSAPPAFLMIYPRSGAVLQDESSLKPLLRVVELGMDVCALRDKDHTNQVEQESSPFISNSLMPGFIHSSPAMTSLVEEVYKIRSSDVTVLVTGESGTGKELVSRAIHITSNRKDRVFIPFNCTAVPKELAEGHLFGYRKGAFTGAVNDSPGMIRTADGGTLFLDEVGDLPLDVQPKLLRFLQEGEVQPIGEKRPIKVDVRVIAATNMPLEQKVADGSFREDLYYRLNVIRLRVPPLRERRSEIPPMINYYINQYSSRFGKRDITITPQAIDLLMVCDWDGNVRQLCNEIQRIIARAENGDIITPEHLSFDLKRNATAIAPLEENGNVRPITSFENKSYISVNIGSQNGTLEEAVSELETQMIRDALARHEWNISRVARELGLTRRGLYLKLSRYGIEKSA